MITIRMKNDLSQRKRAQRRRGSVLLVAVAGMMMVMGFCALAVDYGFLVTDANKLQRACDAAALAGASKLKQTGKDSDDFKNAEDMALLIASQNGVDARTDNKKTVRISFLDGFTKIRVEATEVQDYFFARILGFTKGTVTRYAIAQARGGVVTPMVAPVGITQATYDKYAPGGIPLSNTSGSPGNRAQIYWTNHKDVGLGLDQFILFDLRSVSSNAKSAVKMKAQLEGTEIVERFLYEGIGDGIDPQFVDALDGSSQTSFFNDGMRTRFRAAAGAPWFDSDPSRPYDFLAYLGQHYNAVIGGTEPESAAAPFTRNPRIMNLIITEPISPNGNGNTNSPVLNLAPVYVEKVDPVNRGSRITVRFLPKGFGFKGNTLSLIE